jgi:hypothetical protein
VEIPLGQAKGKAIKSVRVYQDQEALNIDLEFEDRSMLEMICRAGFHTLIKLLEGPDGGYHVVDNIKPIRRSE